MSFDLEGIKQKDIKRCIIENFFVIDMEENIESKQDSVKKTKYIIQYDRIGCIGAAACVAALPEAWEMDEEGKAILKGGNDKGNQIFELEITEDQLEKHMEAAKACPVTVIHIINKETDEKLI